jgi:hypothetical protein
MCNPSGCQRSLEKLAGIVNVRNHGEVDMSAEIIEAMAAAAWNVHGTVTWDKIPEGWKPFHRKCMEAALAVAQNPEVQRLQREIDELRKRELEARAASMPRVIDHTLRNLGFTMVPKL